MAKLEEFSIANPQQVLPLPEIALETNALGDIDLVIDRRLGIGVLVSASPEVPKALIPIVHMILNVN